MPTTISAEAKQQRNRIIADYENKKRKLRNKYDIEKYQATGKTVYDRIFNAPADSIIKLIRNIASESLPEDWRCQVKVEEFTHFILLIYLPHNVDRIPAMKIATCFEPIIKYCNPYISNIAVFDGTHKAYLFFDKNTLKYLMDGNNLTPRRIEKINSQGISFTRFNSVTIQCKKQESFLFLPIEIIGSSGIVSGYTLFDTGASMTMLSENIISSTGNENLTIIPKKSFNTANGWMSCPVVYREINIGGFHKKIRVAVNQIDDISLLGMNFFQGLKYIVDSQNSRIYIWKESSISPPKLSHDTNGDNSIRDMNDLTDFAEKWLEIGP